MKLFGILMHQIVFQDNYTENTINVDLRRHGITLTV